MYRNHLIIAVLCLPFMASCAGKPSEKNSYHSPFLQLKVLYPEGWEVTEDFPNGRVQFTSPRESPEDVFLDNLNISVNPQPVGIDTLENMAVYSRSQIEQFVPGSKILSSETIKVAGRSAHRFVFTMVVGQYPIKSFLVIIPCQKAKMCQFTFGSSLERYEELLPVIEKSLQSLEVPFR